jgi:cytoskeleton protein RodZ
MTQTLGQRLRDIRQSRDISLDEITQKTHIKLAYLKAIEEGDTDSLPSPLQMRGFLRLYAGVLNVDLDELMVQGYLQDEAESDEVMPEETETQPEEDTEVQSDEIKGTEESQEEEAAEPEPAELEEQETIEVFKPEPVLLGDEDKSAEDEPTAAMIFAEIGEQLSQRRDLLSLSYEDIESHIHLRKRYLEAIEAGKFNELPSPIQARGMLANYAEFLNLDVDAILLYFAEGLQKQHLAAQVQKPTSKSARALSPTALRLKNFFSLDLLVIVGIFIIIAGFVIWGVNRILSANIPSTAATELPDVSDVLLSTGSPTPEGTSIPEGTTTVEGGDVTAETENIPLFTAAPNLNPVNLVIIPLQNVWMRVMVDSEVVFEGRLFTGNAYDYSAEEKIELLTGNAGSLQIYFNDQDIGSVGLIGQVADLVFTDTGLVLPTPTNTPTITETPQETPTPTITPTPTGTGTDDQTG